MTHDKGETIFSSIEPELIKRITRREAFAKVFKFGAVAASAPLALGVLSQATFGQSAALPQQIIDVLNFALTLEYLEAEFYELGTKADNLVPRETREVFNTLRDHEAAHVKLLKSTLGAKAVAKPTFDFTAGGAFADAFKNYQTFLALSQAFEDTGVRAYKGQATNLMSNGLILQTALQIHSVEARHAAEVRRIRGEKEWITGNSRGTLPAPTQPVYNGDENTVQGGIDFKGAGGTPPSAATETFDEPLTKPQVLAIVKPFIRG
ncbi:MAG: ferritin-like domain-containing protein [Pyrinomonadaceae bacterium]|nr:ferritin-like domain-containing protein [Pyrinomonadaceae bacterium]